MELSDWGVDGGHLFAYNRVALAPHGSRQMTTFLALTGSLEEARRYSSLAAEINDQGETSK
jgi:hypothetical protein